MNQDGFPATKCATSVWLSRARTVELREEALPDVGPLDVRVRAVVSALSHGSEMLVYRGQVSPDLDLDLPTLRGSFGFPIKYGYASVGRIVEVGRDVTDLTVGDLVFVHHPHQTEYVVSTRVDPGPVRLSRDLDPEHGVFMANVETAINVALDTAPRIGERVAVFGQGVVGLLLTQVLRMCGAGLIISVDPLERRRALSLAVGADVALAPEPDLAAAVRGLTQDAGVDLALEASGNGAALSQAINCVTFGGTVGVCSWYGTKRLEVDLGGAFHRNRIKLISSQVSTIDPCLQPRWNHARRLELVNQILPRLHLSPLITHRIQFQDAGSAFALVDQHPEDTVQVILTYGNGEPS